MEIYKELRYNFDIESEQRTGICKRNIIMEYMIINRDIWERKEYFEHYFSSVPCTYSMTIKLDITNILQKRLKLYPTMLYLLTATVNQYEQFRMALNNRDELILYSNMEPCYTVFHKETETFSNIWTHYSKNYESFCRRYEEDIVRYGRIKQFMAKTNVPENNFTVSMIPWTTFDAFNLNVPNFKYLAPIFTIGKFVEDNGHFYLPLAVQVHHAVCDGFHICRFINTLQSQINSM